MKLILINLLAIICYTYFGYFFLVIVLGRIIKKKVLKAEIFPTVAILIAAYNEEKEIAQKIENSLLLDYPKDKFGIIVVSDGSTDRTDEIVKSYAHLGVELMRIEGRVGKTEARNIALRSVHDEIILFSDATTEYAPDSLQKLVRNFADDSVGMVTGHLIYKDNNSSIGLGQKLFWKYESMIKESQTHMGTLTGSIGCMTAFRRKYYTTLPAHIIEDLTQPLLFVQQGIRVVCEEDALCFEIPNKKPRSEWAMRVRVICGGMTAMIFAKDVLNPIAFPISFFQLISHKVLRWLIPVFGITLFLVNAIAFFGTSPDLFVTVLFALQILFYLTAYVSFVLARRGFHSRILSIPLYFVILNAAALVALYKTFTTRLAVNWETQRD